MMLSCLSVDPFLRFFFFLTQIVTDSHVFRYKMSILDVVLSRFYFVKLALTIKIEDLKGRGSDVSEVTPRAM